VTPRFVTIGVVCFGDWLVKASSFDDQILIFCFNERTIEHHTKMFYSEEKAHSYIEGLVNDTSDKVSIR
jgi:hypothetical protein